MIEVMPLKVSENSGRVIFVPNWEKQADGGVLVTCPNGHIATLGDHAVDPLGYVTPSLVCPKCGWHETVRLIGWANK